MFIGELLLTPYSLFVEGTPSAVTNVQVTPVLGYESDQIMISWSKPITTGNNQGIAITYLLKFCYNEICDNFFNISIPFETTEYKVIDLEKNKRYEYEISTVRADGVLGESYEGEAKTMAEDSRMKRFINLFYEHFCCRNQNFLNTSQPTFTCS